MAPSLRLALAGLVLAGCEWNSPIALDAPDRIDARVPRDGSGIDAPAAATPHLLLTEVALAPAGGEFIEIKNPTAQAVPLANYYLSDSGNYFTLPGGSPTIAGGDFIVQFPAAAMIPAGGVVTVAVSTTAAFMTAYTIAPSYSIGSSTITHTVVTGTPSLTDSGEIIVLFQWDGTADLVKDVDMMIVGSPTPSNGLVSKAGLIQGASAYAADANTIAAQAAIPTSGKSTKRIAAEGANETRDGTGNGISGDDETSEDTSMTWDTTFTAPTPGQVPAGI